MRLYADAGRRGAALRQIPDLPRYPAPGAGPTPRPRPEGSLQSLLRVEPTRAPRRPSRSAGVPASPALPSRTWFPMRRWSGARPSGRGSTRPGRRPARLAAETVVLTGEAGIGEGRLVAELAATAVDGGRVLAGRVEAEQVLRRTVGRRGPRRAAVWRRRLTSCPTDSRASSVVSSAPRPAGPARGVDTSSGCSTR